MSSTHAKSKALKLGELIACFLHLETADPGLSAVDRGPIVKMLNRWRLEGECSFRDESFMRAIYPKYLYQLLGKNLGSVETVHGVDKKGYDSEHSVYTDDRWIVVVAQDAVKFEEELKVLPEYHYQQFRHYIPISEKACNILKRHGFDLPRDLEQFRDQVEALTMPPTIITDIPGFLKKPYQFQLEGVSFIESKNGRAFVGDEMGLGKSITALAWMWLNKKRRPAIIVCPASLKLNWQQEIRECLPKAHVSVLNGRTPYELSPKNDIVIVNYEILFDWTKEILAIKPQLLIVDECFPYWEKVWTECGPIAIGEIVEKQLPVRVWSWDFKTARLVLMRIKRYIKTNSKSIWLTIKHEKGQLTCTGNHKLWTENRGYVTANKIRPGDMLRVVSQTDPKEGLEVQILQQKLLGNVEDATTRSASKSFHTGEYTESNPDLQKQSESQRTISPIITSYEGQQPNGESKKYRKNERNKKEKWDSECAFVRKGRKWKTATTGTANSSASIKVGTRVCCEHQRKLTTRSSHLLQSGHCQSTRENSNRSRWPQPQQSQIARTRPEERSVSCFSRVEGVTVYEQGNNQQSSGSPGRSSVVYNLEVDQTHNYYAAGVLVSNCHRAKARPIKNKKGAVIKGKGTAGLQAIAKPIPYFMALSGTPILNRPEEIWTLLNMLLPGMFPSYWKFVKRYCAARPTPWGWDVSGRSNTKELHALLKETVLIRRMTVDVLKELPPIRRTAVPVAITNRKEYEACKAEFDMWMAQSKGGPSIPTANALARLSALDQITALGKMSAAKEWIENFLEQEDKLVVFAFHKNIINALKELFPDISRVIDGSVSLPLRHEHVKAFQTDPSVRLMIGNYKAAGEGLTMTAAHTTLFIEFPWTPGGCSQAEKRVHRIGQVDSVMGYYMVGEDTVDEKRCKILHRKQKVLDAVLEGKEQSTSVDSVQELLEQLRGELK